MKHRRLAAALVAAVLIGLTCGMPVRACGPYALTAWFWLTKTPNVPLDRYLAGQIGILDIDLDRAYQYVAYRYFSGLGLDSESTAALRAYWKDPPAPRDPWARDPAVEQWEKTRREKSGLAAPPSINPLRDAARDVDGQTYYFWYLNCLSDAFVTAARTLDERVAQFGAGSETVRAWVGAQDQVFHNCAGGESIPEALSDDQPALARADRAYQIAAAHFYAGHLEEAERQFRLIAHDQDSPWHAVSAYLVARAIVRQGTLAEPVNRERLAAAATYLGELLTDRTLASMHPAARTLLDVVRTNLDPAARGRELAAALTRPTLEPTAAQMLFDYLWLLKRYPAADAGDDLGAWMSGRAHGRWSGTHASALLAAAIASMHGSDAGAGELIDAAAQVPPDSPTYVTVAYHRARLLARRGQLDEARQQLDQLLRERPEALSPGDRNRILSLRAPLATSLDEFLRLAQEVPVAVGYDDGTPPPLGTEDKPEFGGRALFIPDAARTLSLYFTPAMMLDVLQRDTLTPYLQRRVALTAWTRAVLTDDDAAAADLLPYVRRMAPELRADVDAYHAAKPGVARRFAAAVMLLRFPGLQPAFGNSVGREQPIGQIDSFRDNWWCAGDTNAPDTPSAPVFVTTEQQAAAAAMHAKLDALGAAPIYLGDIVLGWARSHPRDPRVPEALHLVVRATRYGCANDDGATSRAAFQLLHRRYTRSEWAAQTPFWFK